MWSIGGRWGHKRLARAFVYARCVVDFMHAIDAQRDESRRTADGLAEMKVHQATAFQIRQNWTSYRPGDHTPVPIASKLIAENGLS
jgi:hypothetical protein